ncbi:MAG: AAA family ATPase [Candidatus Gracilibacteria bacterium]
MKIEKLVIDRFRNLNKVEVSFGNINILTGKNSSGKTNFINILDNCLNTDKNLGKKEYLGKNIVTVGKGYKSLNIETTISDIDRLSISHGIGNENKGIATRLLKLTFKNKVSKKYNSSYEQALDSYGQIGKIDYNWSNSVDTRKSVIEKMKKYPVKLKKDTYKKVFNYEVRDDINIENNDKNNNTYLFRMFQNLTKDEIISYNKKSSFSSEEIYNFVLEKYQIETNELLIKELNNKSTKRHSNSFKDSTFHYLLADVQKRKKQREIFYKDLNFFTNGIINKVYINTIAKQGPKGDIFIDSPNAPKDIDYISAGSGVIIFFVLLKNWLELPINEKSYKKPSIMIFDELDSVIHPSLLELFSELLNIIGINIQLFLTTHSPKLIKQFNKKDIYLLKDLGSIGTSYSPISNILSYEDIIEKLEDKDSKKYFNSLDNSELFIEGLIDNIFPINE